MEIITTAAAATAAKSNQNNSSVANASYSKSLMASRALQGSQTNSNEVNLSQLQKGDVFKGEITNITGNSVTVSLGNGQFLTATMQDRVPINIGNQLYFEVTDNTGDKVFVHPLTDEKFSPQNQTIEKSLQSAGLQLNEKNMAVVKELMDAGMPIDRNSIMKVLQQLVNHQDASVSNVVKLMRVGLEVNDANLHQLEQYQTQNSKLNTQMDSVMNSVTKTFESLGGEMGAASEVVRFNQVIVDTFTTTSLNQELPTLLLKDAFVMDEQELADFKTLEQAVEVDGDGKPIVDENGVGFLKGSLELDSAGQPILSEDGSVQYKEEFLKQLLETQPDLSKNELITELNHGSYRMGTELFSSEIQNAFAEQLRTLGINEDAIKMMLDPNNTAEDLLKTLKEFMESSHTLTDAQIKGFLASKEYTLLVESVIENNWKLTPEQVKEPTKIEELFSRVAEQSAKLADAMASGNFSESGEQMGQQSQNMNENLQFIQAMNEKYTFAQIPLQLSNQDANSELYVYTNKKTLHKDKKDCSVLLHLDMDHLGSTDVHVQLNGSNVNARFYLDDNRSMNTVRNHMHELEAKIQALGLSLTTEVVKRPAEKKQEVENIVDDFLAKDIPASQQIKRYTFDMRA